MTYNRKDLAVQVNIKSLKGYTMRDIGALEDRIKKLEYYTVLNALALDTKTLSIRDELGQFERFKNGIFADPFNDHTLGRTEDREYAINVSGFRSSALPRYEAFNHEMKLQTNESSNIRVQGRLALIDYDSEFLAGNPYATTYRNCLESFYSFKGLLQLFPNYDSGKSVIQGAPQNINIDIAGAFKSFLATGIAQTIDTEVGNPIRTGQTSTTRGFIETQVNTWSQTTTTTIKDIAVDVTSQPQNIGPVVQDVSLLPYMRSRIIAVVGRGLRPNSTVHCFFDKVLVDKHCVSAYVNPAFADINGKIDPDKLKDLVGGQENDILRPMERNISNVPDAPLNTFMTDSEGTIYILFTLPDETFRTGEKVFVISNVDDLNATGAIITSAEGIYTASALSVKTTDLSFNVLKPTFTPTTLVETSTRTWTTTNTVDHTPRQPPDHDRPDPPGRAAVDDPVAETFIIQDSTEVNVPGVYLTQIGVYFKKKSLFSGITMRVTETTAGLVDHAKFVASAHLDPAAITVSNDSSIETIFTLENPALLQSDRQYAFYLIPDGGDPDFEIWISEVGGKDVLTGVAVNQQPFAGVMQVSSNGKNWSIIQSQDIKFKLYRAKFLSDTGTAVFSNETYDYFTLQNTVRANTGIGIRIGHVVYAANSANLAQTLVDTTINPFGIVSSVDELNNKLYLERTNGLFNNTTFKDIRIYSVADYANTQEIIATNLIANTRIATIDDLPYHSIAPKFVVIEPVGSTASFNFFGTSNTTAAVGSNVKDTIPVIVNNEEITDYIDYERVLLSYSNQVALGGFGSRGNATYEVNFFTNSNYVSPVVDLGTKTVKLIKNVISSNNVNEHTRYGYALNRYVSQVVALATKAEDLRVYITGYRPPGSDIEVYAKFKSDTDTENFDDKAWTKLVPIKNDSGSNTGLLFSNSPSDYKELLYGIPQGYTPVLNVNVSGTTLTVNQVTGAGALAVGKTVVGPGILPETLVTALGTGTGGVGTYTISRSHSAIGPIDVKATPNSPSANIAYADYNAATYSGSKLPDGVLTYYDNSYSLQTTFNQFALKILLLADDPVKVPNMRDVRAIAMMMP